MTANKIPLTVVGGPTASGKTELAIRIVEKTGGEIVSADSMQVYKYMDIGSAKPTPAERARAKHHLIDIIYPDESFNVVTYTSLANDAIADIHSRGRLPILSGGTGMYINAVINAVGFSESQSDTAMREELAAIAAKKGNEYLHNMLKTIDPIAAERLHPNDIRRVARAIEIYKTTGITMTQHIENSASDSPYSLTYLAIDHDRQTLYDRIDKRVDMMFSQGLLDEVKQLLKMGYGSRNLTSMQAIGYKEVVDYLRGLCSYDDMVDIIKRSSRQYAKRQLTWFRRDKRVRWIAPSEIEKVIDEF